MSSMKCLNNYIQESKNKMITKLDTIENFNFYSMCKSLWEKISIDL